MSSKTSIEWTDSTWNPVVGCSRISEGCRHCYAERLAHRYGWTALPWTWPNAAQNVQMHPERLLQPLSWKLHRRIFVCSMADLFHEDVPSEYIAAVYGAMALAGHHTYQVLTKRPARASAWHNWLERQAELDDSDVQAWQREKLPIAIDRRTAICVGYARAYQPKVRLWTVRHCWTWPLANVGFGITAENQDELDRRAGYALAVAAPWRFISYEPALGPIDLAPYLTARDASNQRFDWVIAGGESGPGARPLDPDWLRSARDQCQAAGASFFLKQLGGYPNKRGGDEARLDGRRWAEYPEALR